MRLLKDIMDFYLKWNRCKLEDDIMDWIKLTMIAGYSGEISILNEIEDD